MTAPVRTEGVVVVHGGAQLVLEVDEVDGEREDAVDRHVGVYLRLAVGGDLAAVVHEQLDRLGTHLRDGSGMA